MSPATDNAASKLDEDRVVIRFCSFSDFEKTRRIGGFFSTGDKALQKP
jgi:hypothetical protein